MGVSPACKSVRRVWKSEQAGIAVTDGCEPPCGYLETNPCSLEEQPLSHLCPCYLFLK